MALAPSPTSLALPKPAVRYFDETFDPVHRIAYGLYVVLTADGGARLGVAHSARNKFVVLEDYPASELGLSAVASPDALQASPATALRALALHHSWLGLRGWGHVRVAVQHERFTLLPGALYRSADAEALLGLHCELDLAHERVLTYHHAVPDITTLFAAERELPDWLQATYGAGVPRVLHHTDALLAAALHRTEPTVTPAVVSLHMLAGLLTLVVTRERQLLFCNAFRFTTAEELMYYTLLVLQEVGLAPEQVPITVWGDLPHDSALLTMLRRYVRTVKLGQRSPDVHYGYRFDDAFPHRYAEVFSLHLCE